MKKIVIVVIIIFISVLVFVYGNEVFKINSSTVNEEKLDIVSEENENNRTNI